MMASFPFTLKDRQTGKITYMHVEGNSMKEAKAKAMAEYGIAYEIL